MRDSNLAKVIWIGCVAVLVFVAILMSQLNSGQTDGQAKDAACSQAKRSYAHAASRPLQGREREAQTSGAEQRKQNALQHDALIDAAGACTAAAISHTGMNAFWTILLRTLPTVFGILALVMAGVRYDADRRQMLGGKHVRLDIVRSVDAGAGEWTVRNLSGGTQTVEAFDVLPYPTTGLSRAALSGLGRLHQPRSIHSTESTTLESMARGVDLLVAALVRDIDGNAVICWARFIGHGQQMRKAEEGRLL